MRSILVTGGTRGIGAEISRRFKSENVLALYHSNSEAAEKIEQEGIKTIKCDVGSFEDIDEKWPQIERILQGKVDVFVHNAGITRDARLVKMMLKDWEDVRKTHLDSCFYFSKKIIPLMMEKKFGRMIFISSVNGQKGQFGQTNYSAAKAGMIGFAKSLALEVASHGITVNAIAPGYIDTEMLNAVPEKIMEQIIKTIPQNRLGKASEIGALVEFLASENASYITGSTYNINGGLFIN